METRRCTRCTQVKDRSLFYGTGTYCKPCQAGYMKEWRANNLDRAAQTSRDWKKAHPERHAAVTSAWQKANRERINKRQAAYREANRELHNEWSRDHRYGLKRGEFDAILAAQDGRCAICRVKMDGNRKLHFDHDHRTARNRGILCRGCNHGLGNFGDDPDRLLAAVAYLQKYST